VPIKPGYKFPGLDDWQAGHPPAHYLPYRGPENGRLTDCSRWGVGTLTEFCPAIDLDIKDRELVRVMIDMAGEVLGPTPFRIGARPKALLPYSTRAPFDKISGRWWALPGEDYEVDGYSPHRIEILGRGQQFVAYARHPGTKRPYRWRRGCLMDTMLIDLPEIDEASARAFLTAAEATIEGIGGTALRKSKGQWIEDVPEVLGQLSGRDRPAGGFDRRWERLEPEILAKVINASTARPLRKNGGWITSCPAHKSEGARSLSITKRDGGGSVVHCFAECAFADIADAIHDIVGAL
jgi:hypothetical protein